MADRVALITGAGGGIGSATVECLMRDGVSIVGIGRSAEPLEKLRDRMQGMGEMAIGQVDVTQDDAPSRAVELAMDKFGRLDVLVNNAGVGAPKWIADTSDALADEFIAVHLRAPMRFSREVVKVMTPGSAIINIASCMGLRARPRGGMYTAVKAALGALTWQLACEFGPKGIRSNAVAPGVIETPMGATVAGNKFLERLMLETVPLPTPTGQPEDIGEAVAFLSSARAKFINGQILAVDGGWSTTHYLNDAALER